MFRKKKKQKLDPKKIKRIDFINYLGIDEITDDIVILKDGVMFAVLRIKPIHFERLNEKNQEKVTSAYRRWIESLKYPVQIVARTVNDELNEQISIFKSTTEKDIKDRNEDFKESLSKFREFSDWIKIYSEKTKPKRLFYLVIPYFPVYNSDSELKKRKDYILSVKKLNKRVVESKKLLEDTGVKIRRLSDEQLKNFYESYFKMHFVFNRDKMPFYFNADKWLEVWKADRKPMEE